MGEVACCLNRDPPEDSDAPEGFAKPVKAGKGGGASCSCSNFKQNGSCKHLPPELGGLPKTPRVAKEEALEDDLRIGHSDDHLEVSRPPIVVDSKLIAWYMTEDKHVEARGENRCALFLDVDGVLHPFGAFGKESFCHLSLLLDILEATGCDVVLSSSWRMDAEGIQEVNDRLRELRPGLATREAEVLDITERTRGRLNQVGNRDLEILAWVRAHAKEAGFDDRWIALDDLDLTRALGEEHCVVTDYDLGLTEEKVAEAIAKLKTLVSGRKSGWF